MANLQIKDLPEDMHAELRRRAAAQGTSVRALLLDLIRRELERPSPQDWLARLESLDRVEPERRSADLVREARDERAAGARGR
jgi:plasmid stability protein